MIAGSIFVFSLTMGDFVAPQLVGGGSQVLGGAIKDRFGVAADFPFGAALASLTLVTLIVFLTITRRTGALENADDAARGRRSSIFGGTSALVLAFLYLPLFLIVLYAFNETNINSWPFPGFSTRWFDKLVPRPGAEGGGLAVGEDRARLDRARARCSAPAWRSPSRAIASSAARS